VDQHKLSQLFNRFVGREVPLVERNYEIGKDRKPLKQLELVNADDPTLREMRQVAQQHNLSLRVWWPGVTTHKMDFRHDRANTFIEQGQDGRWRVANRFTIG
jgi:hypothetical protein